MSEYYDVLMGIKVALEAIHTDLQYLAVVWVVFFWIRFWFKD